MNHDAGETSLWPPSFLIHSGRHGLEADRGRPQVSPDSSTRGLSSSASPSLSPTYTQAPSNLKRFTDHISSGLQALDKGPGSHHSPGNLGEKKDGEKNHNIVMCQSRLEPRDCTKRTRRGVKFVELPWGG